MPVDVKNALGPNDLPSLWFRTNRLHDPKVPAQKAWYQLGQAFRANCMKDAITLKEHRLNKIEGADPYDFWRLESLCTKCKESQCYCDYDMESYVEAHANDDLFREYNVIPIRSEPKIAPKVKKTPKQFEFAFEFKLNGEKCSTTYSPKNQYLLMRAWKDGDYWCAISHEVQKGPNKGTQVLHKVFFDSDKVQTQTGAIHKLLLSEKKLLAPPVSPIITSVPSKKFDWHMKSKIAKLVASRIKIDDYNISELDISSISNSEEDHERERFLPWDSYW